MGRASLSQTWLMIHRWTGLGLGLFLAVQGLLGAWLLVADPLDRWLNPQLLQSEASEGQPIGLTGAYQATADAYPDRHVWLVMRPDEPDEVYRAILDGDGGTHVYVDAYSGEVLGARGAFSSLEEPVRVLHTGALGGPWLESFAGVLAVALLGLGITGLVVWWPGLGSLRRALGFATASWADVMRDLHRWAGLLGFVFLTLVAVSGIYLIFHHAVQDTVNAVTGEPEFPPPLSIEARAGPASDPDVAALVAAARAEVPGARPTLFSFPAEAGNPIQVRLRYPGEWHPIGNSTVLFHPDSQRVVAAYDMRRAGAGHVALDHLYPLHIGSYGGTVTRTVHFAAGLLPALFFATGLYLWWRRRRRRACRRRPARNATAKRGEG